MKIGIYDTEHFETTYALIRISDVPENSITLFLTAPVASILKEMLGKDAERYTWILKKGGSITYLIKIFQVCIKDKLDILFLNTVSYHHLLVAFLCFFLKKTKTILTVHDANSFFHPKFSFHFRKSIRSAGIKMLTWVVPAYTTLLSTTKTLIKEKYGIKKPVYCIPGGIFEKNATNTKEQNIDILKIVIPGSIDKNRRDYDQLFQLIKELEPNKKRIQMVLLGTTIGDYGKEVIEKCKRNSSENINIVFYETKFIEQNEFDKQMNDSHFVLIPLVKVTLGENGRLEEYGVTKAAGGFFDAIRFGKPMLIPDYITIPEELKKQVISYTSIHMLSQFIYNISAGSIYYNDILDKSIQNSMPFEENAVRTSLRNVKLLK
ncbi:MAG: hypothetical protein ABR502_05680 [Chitinophagaceae bacterium]